MTSKEALEIIELALNNHSIMLEVNDKRNEYLNAIKQDLERLEVLEIENEQLKGNEDIVSNYAYSLKEENEKLKKALEILKNSLIIEFNDDLQYIHLKEDILQSCDYTIADIEDKQEYELLKEVLK